MCKASWKCAITCQKTILIQLLQLCCNMSSLSMAFRSWWKELYLDMSFNAKPVVGCVCRIACNVSLSSFLSCVSMYAYVHVQIHIITFSVYHRNKYIAVAAAVQWSNREPWKSHWCPKAFQLWVWAGLQKVTATPCKHYRIFLAFFSAYGREEKYRSGNLSAQVILLVRQHFTAVLSYRGLI